MTFDQVNEALGLFRRLPGSAYAHRSWWANNERSPQAKAWLYQGRRTDKVDLQGRQVTFWCDGGDALLEARRHSVRRSKYDKLGEFLDKQTASPVSMTFSEAAAVLGFPLPDSAYRHETWWANSTGHSHANAWVVSRGRHTDLVSIKGRHLIFYRFQRDVLAQGIRRALLSAKYRQDF